MRVCLINAPTGAEFHDPVEFGSDTIRRESCSPQLGILSLAAVVEQLGLPVSIYDPNRAFFRISDELGEEHLPHFAEMAAREILSIDADVYGFGTICSAYPLTLRIARLVRQSRPDATILLGGPQASVVAEPALHAFPFVDFVLRGESEATLPVFLEELSSRRRFDQVPGLAYRSAFGVQRNPDAAALADLDAIPSPAYHLTGELRGARTASLELGRGCPFACTFCSTNDFFRRKFRLRSPQRVLEEMRAIEAEYGITNFNLTHDMFTVDAKRVRAFCQAMIDSGKNYAWSCSARTDCVDQELIEFMAAAGCEGIFFGVETGSDRMQGIIDKHLDVERAHKIIDITERAGVRSTVSLIMGFPQENQDDLRGTLRVFAHSSRTSHSNPQINLLAPLANTPMHLQFRGQMTLDELCSDMSHQGRLQNPDDVALIRKFPDIFPNFYLLPTPRLDRALLLELREFLLMTNHRSRWVLSAADQAGNGILNVFLEWVEHRKSIFPGEPGPDLRHYYRTPEFFRDLLPFLRSHRASRDARLRIILDFYERLNQASPLDGSLIANAHPLAASQKMIDTDLPIRRRRSRVVELDWNLDAVVKAIQQSREIDPQPERHYYVVSQVETQENPGYEVPRILAEVVKRCDGTRTVAELKTELRAQIVITPASAGDPVYEMLLEKARAEGLIEIHRPDSSSPPRHAESRVPPVSSDHDSHPTSAVIQ